MKKLKVRENKSLERDPISKAIINVDASGYQQARLRKKNKLAEKNTILDLISRVEALEKKLKLDK